VISFHQATVGRGTGTRTQTDGLKGRRAAVTACPLGATRENRTPSRCLHDSYAPERWWRGDQPWDRTTFSRTSAERYDHTSSLVVGGADGGSRTRACALRGRRASGNTSSTWSRLEDSNPDSPVIGRTSCLLDEAWVGPVGWSRTSMVPLKRRGHSRSATTGYGGMKLGCRAGIRTRILPVNSRTCCRCHHPTIEDENEAGCQTWTRTTIRGVRGRCPAVGRPGNGRVGRTRTSTHLRPRQVGYRLPYDPKN
jgi:hypothetical protein